MTLAYQRLTMLLPSEGVHSYDAKMPPYQVGSTSDPMLGRLVEGYRITRLVGKGGMGVVYEAVHEEIGQRVAVKVLFPEFSTDVEAVSRFVAEARAASKVSHGGLVKIFYSGRLEDGTAYIMMEFLDGESIEHRLHRITTTGERIDDATVIRIGQQIASALSAVHREGVVHRDLKPANVILVADPEVIGGERIKVVDFGIAKFDQATTEISKTTVGRFLGTALYASPEQCQMAGEVGPKADVYSLGVMLYEMLVGKPPFWAEQPGLVIGMHLFVPPTPLFEKVPNVPESLHRLVHEMLAKSPDRRPAMDEVASRLAAAKQERPRLIWRLRRNGRTLVAVGGMAVLVSAGTLWRLVQGRRSMEPTSVRSASIQLSAGQITAVPLTTPTDVPLDLGVVAPPDLSFSADLATSVPMALRSSEPKRLTRSKPVHGTGAPRVSKQNSAEPHTTQSTPTAATVPIHAGEPTTPAPEHKPKIPTTEENTHVKPAKVDDGILR